MDCQADGRGCARCERLPEAPSEDWTLYIWPPQGHSGGKLERHLTAAGIALARAEDGRALKLQLSDDGTRAAIAGLAEPLSVEELKDTRVLAMVGARAPDFADYPRVTSLERTINFLRSGPLLDILREESFTVAYAPIVYADDHDDVLAHEARLNFPAMDAGPAEVFELAEKADLLHQLDRAARVACIERAPDGGIDTPIFVEFQPTAIYDPVYCLRTTVAAAQRVGVAPENIVFTLSHPNRGYDIQHLRNILSFYRQRGFRVALGQLGSGIGSLELLQHLRPEFAWLSAELVAGIDGDPYRGVIARKLLEMAHRLRIETIAEGGLSRADHAWLYEHGVSYLALGDATATAAKAAAAKAAAAE